MSSKLRCIILSFICVFLVVSCTAAKKEKSKEGLTISSYIPPNEKVLRVGVSANAPPLIYKEGDTIVGLEAEFAKEFAKYLGKSLRFVEVKWVDQIPALQKNWTDIIMAGMSITIARKHKIAFSEPYFRTGQMALVRKVDRNRYLGKGYYSILGQSILLRIGVVKGTTGEFFVRRNFGSAKEILPFSSSNEGTDALINSDIDILIHDAPMVFRLASENESDLVPVASLLTEEYLAWGIRKDDTQLIEAANSFIEKLKSEGKLNAIVNRWIPFIK